MLKGFANLASLMRNAQELQARTAEMQERLAALRAEGSAGGGMVRAEVSGTQKVLSVKIEESLLNSGDQEMLEDLLVSAVNQALEQSRELAAGEMASLADGLGLDGLEDALAKFGLGRS